MEFTKEQSKLIAKLIKADKKFSGNEDLLDDFCGETYKRCYSLLSTISDISSMESYLSKVVSSAMIKVLKDSARLRKTGKGYVATKEISLDSPVSVDTDGEQSFKDLVYDIKDPGQDVEKIVINKDLLEKIYDLVKAIDLKSPKANYSQIFFLRYSKGLTQSEIAKTTGLSQSEVSKRLFELAEIVKKQI